MSAWRRTAALLSLAWISLLPVRAETLDSIKQTIRKRFPLVPQLSTAELAAWLADTNRPPPLLVDVREPKEFAVSHLRGARNLTTVASVESAAPSPLQPVVLYCSVGYRSSALAQKLQRAGFTNVVNLEGSLFQWANEGRTLHNGTNVVRDIHGYSRKWGEMLHADVPVRF
jgi:rhodanese-related sulfurtransferase